MARPLIAGEFFTNVGRGAATLSLAWYWYRLTGNVWAVALASLSELAMSLLLRRASGVLIDRASARRVLGGASALLAALFLPLPLAGDLYSYSIVLGLLLALAANALRTLTSAATYAGVVTYARGREDAVNSAMTIAMQAGQFCGMAVAGLTLELGTINLAGLAVGCSYALAALCYPVLPALQAAGASDTKAPALADERLFAMLRAHPMLARYSLLGALDFALVGAFNLILAPVVTLAFAGEARWMGVLDATFTVGALLGGAVLPLVWKRMVQRGWAVSLLSCGAATCALYAMSSAKGPLLYACLLLFGVAVNVSYMFWMTAAQTVTPAEFSGRIGAMRTVVNGCALTVASAAIASISPLSMDKLLWLALALPLVCLMAALLLAMPATARGRQQTPK